MLEFLKDWLPHWGHGGQQGAPLTGKLPGSVKRYRFAHHSLQLNDVELAYIDEGGPDKAVLLFVHGVGGGIPVWEKNVEVLKENHRCIALDLPGHGFSSRGAYSYTVEFYAGVLLAFIEKLELKEVCLCGHSMGGQVAMKAAVKRKDLISKLVLLAPSGVEPYFLWERQLLLASMNGTYACGQAFTKNRFTYQTGFCNDIALTNELMGKLAFSMDEGMDFARMVLRSVEGMLLDPVNALTVQIQQPALVLLGVDDRVSPYNYLRPASYADVAERVCKQMPRSKVKRMRGGHFVQYQYPEDFNRELSDFFESQSAKRTIQLAEYKS